MYHAFPGRVLRRAKEVFRRLDHAAIYLLIAGTVFVLAGSGCHVWAVLAYVFTPGTM